MASNKKKSKAIRKRKATRAGKVRKRQLVAKGTTPPFPIHVAEHEEAVASKVKPKKKAEEKPKKTVAKEAKAAPKMSPAKKPKESAKKKTGTAIKRESKKSAKKQ